MRPIYIAIINCIQLKKIFFFDNRNKYYLYNPNVEKLFVPIWILTISAASSDFTNYNDRMAYLYIIKSMVITNKL